MMVAMGFGEPRIEMSLEEFLSLRELLGRACGFELRDNLKSAAERKLAPRLEALGLTSFAAYARSLNFDADGARELEVAIDLLVPQETYFFRGPGQLSSFQRELLPQLEAKNEGSRSLHLWSAGCSTGEEPYTLSMLLHERPTLAHWELDILGTDLSRPALLKARQAEYGPSALRDTSPERRARFFESAPGGRVRVLPAVRDQVRFSHLNLIDPPAASVPSHLDAIFCRNVLVYFDAKTRQRVAELFFQRLSPGGFLLLGHAENLFQMSTGFEVVQLEHDLVYRKPGP